MQEFNAKDFQQYLDRNCHEIRQKWREFTKNPLFKPIHNQDIHDQKVLALKRLQYLSQQKVFSIQDFLVDPLRVFANHEMAALTDGSFATKLTVQYNLFGGTVVTLGSQRHQHISKGIDSLETIGCFALTELGYGNNAIEMETQAVYDEKTQTFIINTPTVMSQKYWITNGALHSNYSVVFAQLIVKGKQEGIHTFLVRIREDDGSLSKGVWLECMGHKIGLNGVDNARIQFKDVVIPKANMLNKYSDINDNNEYVSSIKSRRDRFLRMGDRLLSGRLCIASMMISCTKLLLTVTFRFGNKRLAVGQSGKSDTTIRQFNLFQNALYPLLCRTVVLNIAHNVIKDKYVKYATVEPNQDIISLCCFIKPFISWNARDVAAQCVERCGGQGYLSVNRLGEGIAFAHSGITAEGDNRVLMQKVAKEIASMAQKKILQFGNMNMCPKREMVNIKDINDLNIMFNFISYREIVAMGNLQKVTMEKLQNGKNFYDVWMKEDNDFVQDLAYAYGERKVMEFCIEELKTMPKSIQGLMTLVMKCYGLFIIQQNIGFYFTQCGMSKEAAQSVNVNLRNIIKELHPHVMNITENFGIPEHLITAPIAQDFSDYNSRPNKGELAKL